jgi:hypothetical protein
MMRYSIVADIYGGWYIYDTQHGTIVQQRNGHYRANRWHTLWNVIYLSCIYGE